jgi:uncharacterized protein YukE
MNPFGDANSVDHLAVSFEGAAREIRAVEDRLRHREQSLQWAGAAATQFRSALQDRGETLRTRGDELAEIARALRRHATWIRERTADLRQVELLVRRALETVQHAASPPLWLKASGINPSLLPQALSLDWFKIATKLRQHGVIG